MADASPTKWHLAHVTWFFETFLLERFEAGFAPFDPAFRVLFNSYYQGVGAQHPRAQRGLITRPDSGRGACAIALDVDERMQALLAARAGDDRDRGADRPRPAARAAAPGAAAHRHQARAVVQSARLGVCEALADGAGATAAAALVRLRRRPGRARPRPPAPTARSASTTRRRATAPTRRRSSSPRGRRPTATSSPSSTTAAIARPELWLSMGWDWVRGRRPRGAALLARDGDRWCSHTLQGTVEIDPHTPVCHLSYFEADAFARWSGARLPTELEWELAARALRATARGNFADRGAFHPLPQKDPVGDEPVQMFGDVWEWTAVGVPAVPRLPAAAGARRRVQRQVHVQPVRPARRLVRDAGRPRARELPQLLPARRAMAVQRRPPGARRVKRDVRTAPQARLRRASTLIVPRAERGQDEHATGDRQVLQEVDLLAPSARPAGAAQKGVEDEAGEHREDGEKRPPSAG